MKQIYHNTTVSIALLEQSISDNITEIKINKHLVLAAEAAAAAVDAVLQLQQLLLLLHVPQCADVHRKYAIASKHFHIDTHKHTNTRWMPSASARWIWVWRTVTTCSYARRPLHAEIMHSYLTFIRAESSEMRRWESENGTEIIWKYGWKLLPNIHARMSLTETICND